jgi:hypothetical protein
MKKTPKKKTKPASPIRKDSGRSLARQSAATAPSQADFDVVVNLIDRARTCAIAAINTTLIELYWNIGELVVSPFCVGGSAYPRSAIKR